MLKRIFKTMPFITLCVLVLTVSLFPGNSNKKANEHFDKLKAAFEADKFLVDSYIEYPEGSGKFGIRAKSTIAFNSKTNTPKYVLYLEGKPADMGYQMGYLAEQEVSQMTTTYVKVVLADFINPNLPGALKKIIGEKIDKFLLPGVKKLAQSPAIPQEYKDQVNGILNGCKKAKKLTRVNLDDLELLNYGVDVLCAMLYEGTLPQQEGILPNQLRIPISCNAFSLKGTRDGKDYHYFGRDFQFENGGVFQDTACLIIYNPDSTFNGKKALPSVVQSAPGMVGAITVMNSNGVAMGVDMAPSHACDPDNPGLDSLLMTRHSVQYGPNADETAARVKEASRGVSWLYPFADGTTGKAGVIETIKSLSYNSKEDLANYLYDIPFQTPKRFILNNIMEKPLEDLKNILPNSDFIANHMTDAAYNDLKTGIFVRWSDYQYPPYLDTNSMLWGWFNQWLEHIFGYKDFHDDALTCTGAIDRTTTNQPTCLIYEKNCPLTYYFAPLRSCNPNEILVTNFFISPELRYTSMHYWVALLLGATNMIDDLQWRYDTLNSLIDEALKKGSGSVDKETARNLIDFLNPLTGQFPGYYLKCNESRPIQILGSVSLCDLKAKTIESHFGYYEDQWVTITLPNYFK
ncbi:MAG TPA: hypothetical protein VK469_05430 [Candidatus Kapabacteria bacterium]|nr:hypothetical protein [Candidatus Kapabacteria bacterium]